MTGVLDVLLTSVVAKKIRFIGSTVAAVGLAGLLVTILRGDAVKQILMDLVSTALSVAG
jgi:hypothetical protein